MNRKIAFTLAMLAILAFAAYYAFSCAEGVSTYGDDPNYTWLASALSKGIFKINPDYIFTLRPMSFIPIAIIYSIFGANLLTSTLWNIISYLGIIILAFIAGRFFYDDIAGLFAAIAIAMFPMLTKFAVNIGVDVPLTFVGSLSIMLFFFATKNNKWHYYLASGILLVATFFIDYEGGIIVAFVFLYALLMLFSKKLKINKITIQFVYGIMLALLIAFILSDINIGQPFILITGNINFYSHVGVANSTLITIPSANTNLYFYINEMFPYHLYNLFSENASFSSKLQQLYANLFGSVNSNEAGIYFYILIPAIIFLLLFREKKAYLPIFWFAFSFFVLEFGPMSVLSLHPLELHYLLAHRLMRFMMITSIPLGVILGIAFAKLVERKSKIFQAIGIIFVTLLIAITFFNSLVITSYWYYWIYYPTSIIGQAGSYLRSQGYSQIFLENVLSVNYGAIMLPEYLGDPSTNKVDFSITNQTNCNTFTPGSYVIWSGPKKCSNWINKLNITIPSSIPSYIKSIETPLLPYLPTNVYYVK
ncbi:MAG: glycosyltransferase family 39 protein [Candidatus Micrarchaeaceae archaeon]